MFKEQTIEELFSVIKTTGAVLKEMQPKLNRLSFIEKMNQENNYVTEADVFSEKKIIDYLKKNYPEDSIISEESDQQLEEGKYVWHLDPLDGTVNYARGYEHWAISLARTNQHTSETEIAIVHSPPLNKTWFYVNTFDEKNSYLIEGEDFHLIERENSPGKILATGMSYDKKVREQYLAMLPALMKNFSDIRHIGSTALNFCFLAEGRVDAFYDLEFQIWDWKAGAAIAKKAGNNLILEQNPNNSWRIKANLS